MEWLRDHLWETWLGLSLVLAAAEMLSLDLVLLMLAVGALGGMVTALAGGALAVQVMVAVAVAVGLLVFVRPAVVKRLHSGPDLKIGHQAIIGETGRVLKAITPAQSGEIKVRGQIWTALPYDERETIEIGDAVDVLEVRGATALVMKRAELT